MAATNDSKTGASAKGYMPEMSWNDTCTNPFLVDYYSLSSVEEVCNDAISQLPGLVEMGSGSGGVRTSEITIIGNLFFDCDNAATAKQGNFFTLINNTIVHMTRTDPTTRSPTPSRATASTPPGPSRAARRRGLERRAGTWSDRFRPGTMADPG